ncbi:DNA-binding protein [Planctomycetota bacterium]|nr:DNA-binding protein [Planctomycetota bacterium]
MSGTGQAFLSPRSLATAIGLSESSLKRWIDGGRLAVVRTAGGHRRIPVTEAVRFIREQRLMVVDGSHLGLESPGPGGSPLPSSDDADERIHAALLSGDPIRLRNLLSGMFLAGASLASLSDGPLCRSLRRIGELWTHGEDGIAVEHLATDCCLHAVQFVRSLLPPTPATAPIALGCAPSGDPYLLPTTLAAAVLAEGGWNAVNLGPETPTRVLRLAVIRHQPRLVWVAASTETSDIPGLLTDLEELAATTGIPVVVGGRIFRERPVPQGKLLHAASLSELAGLARGLREPPDQLSRA